MIGYGTENDLKLDFVVTCESKLSTPPLAPGRIAYEIRRDQASASVPRNPCASLRRRSLLMVLYTVAWLQRGLNSPLEREFFQIELKIVVIVA